MVQQTEFTSTPKRRLRSRLTVTVLIFALVWLLAAVTPSPYAIQGPGPVVNALGSFETPDGDVTVITVQGAETYESVGELNVLSVALYGNPDSPLTWLEVARAAFDSSKEVVPLRTLYPEGVSVEDRTAASALMMHSSQQLAVAAALGELGEAVSSQLVVVDVLDDGASAGILQRDDVLLELDGEPVASLGEFSQKMSLALATTNLIEFTVKRGDHTHAVQIEPRELAPEGERVLGISLAFEFVFPVDISVELGEIGGPSAGMIFALAVYETLTPDSLIDDLIISGSGTIDELGNIGRIGGLPQKLWGAAKADTDLFLMAVANCADLPSRIPGDFHVAPVATLHEAIAAIEQVAAGEVPAGVERCQN